MNPNPFPSARPSAETHRIMERLEQIAAPDALVDDVIARCLLADTCRELSMTQAVEIDRLQANCDRLQGQVTQAVGLLEVAPRIYGGKLAEAERVMSQLAEEVAASRLAVHGGVRNGLTAGLICGTLFGAVVASIIASLI